MSRILDLTGETFGKLKVIRLTVAPEDRANKDGTWWVCECLGCGRHEVIRGADLRENRRRQCRECKINSRDKAGQEHGTWLVLREATEDEKPATKSAKRTSWWKVRCVLCGKETIRNREQLHKRLKQCECIGVPKQPRPFVNRTGDDNKVKRPLPENSRRCEHCGKIFDLETYGQWGWTIGTLYFCTYRCMREYEKIPKNKKYKKRGLDNE